MHKLSITTKLTCTLFLVIALLLSSFGYLVFQTYEQLLLTEGRDLARQVILFRHWAAGYGGVWSRDSYGKDFGYLLEYDSREGETKNVLGESLTVGGSSFYLHNPALATRELAKLSRQNYGWTFRVVSDRNMSPESAPDDFELQAITNMQGSGADEYWSWAGTDFRYAKALFVAKSCLKCHGDNKEIPAATMKALRAKYGENVERATGYKTGELRGIVSIHILPMDLVTMAKSFLNIYNVGSLVLAIAIFWFFVQRVIIRRLKKLSTAAYQASVGEIDVDFDFKIQGLEMDDVADEISKLAIAFKRLPGMDNAIEKKKM